MKVEESLNVTFDECPHPIKLSPLVDDDVGEEEVIENNVKVANNNIEDEYLEVKKVVNIKEFKNHPLEQVIVPLPKNHIVIGTKWVYRNKLDENGIVSRNKARLVAQGYNQQEGLQIKQMEDRIFFNQSKYIQEMLKKFGMEDSKPTKTPMSTEIKLTKDDVADSMDITNYRETRRPCNLTYFIVMRMYYFRDRHDKVLPYDMILTRLFRNLKASIEISPFDNHYILVPRRMSSRKAKQPKRPPLKRTKSVGKSKRAQLTTSSSSHLPPLDNGELPSTKLSPRSYYIPSPFVNTCRMTKRRQEGCSRTWLGHCISLQRC
nr:hypothetical protein [Tanacetum cinerariifolium]